MGSMKEQKNLQSASNENKVALNEQLLLLKRKAQDNDKKRKEQYNLNWLYIDIKIGWE